MIRSKYVALVNLCVSSKNMTREAAEAMRDVAATFVEEKLGPTDVAGLLLEGSDEEAAVRKLADSYEEAVPEPASSAAARSANPPAERIVLGTPPTEAGEKLRGLARQTLPDQEVLRAVSEEDLLFYREWKNLLLA